MPHLVSSSHTKDDEIIAGSMRSSDHASAAFRLPVPTIWDHGAGRPTPTRPVVIADDVVAWVKSGLALFVNYLQNG